MENIGKQLILVTWKPGNIGKQSILGILWFLLLDLNASNQSNCSYYWTSIKPFNWTAILEAIPLNKSANQPSWKSFH